MFNTPDVPVGWEFCRLSQKVLYRPTSSPPTFFYYLFIFLSLLQMSDNPI